MKLLKTLIVFVVISFTNNASFAQTITDTLKTYTLSVSGLTCNGDMPTIKKKLINKDGIDDVTFTELKKGKVTFTIQYHTSITTEAQIREWIETVPGCDNPNTFPYKTFPIILKLKKQ